MKIKDALSAFGVIDRNMDAHHFWQLNCTHCNKTQFAACNVTADQVVDFDKSVSYGPLWVLCPCGALFNGWIHSVKSLLESDDELMHVGFAGKPEDVVRFLGEWQQGISKVDQSIAAWMESQEMGSEKIAPDALRASLGEPESKEAVHLEKNRLLQAPKLQMPTDCLTGLCGHLTKVYARVSLAGGGSYVQPLDEIHQAIDGELYDADPGTKLTIELIEMNECTYLVTPDFQGH